MRQTPGGIAITIVIRVYKAHNRAGRRRRGLPSRLCTLPERQDLCAKRVAVGLTGLRWREPGGPKHVRPPIRSAHREIRLRRVQAEAPCKLDEKDPAVVVVFLLRHRGAAESNGACGTTSASARDKKHWMKCSPPLPNSASPRLSGWLRRAAHSRARYLRKTSSTFACVPVARRSAGARASGCRGCTPDMEFRCRMTGVGPTASAGS